MDSNSDGELVYTVGRENPQEEGTLLKGIFHFEVEMACLILSGISVGYTGYLQVSTNVWNFQGIKLNLLVLPVKCLTLA